MFKRSRRPVVDAPPPERTTDGALIWAIGDIHGRLDLLDTLLPAVLKDFKASKVKRSILIFLGDYVDRGPDSKGVIDRLCSLEDVRALEAHFVRGNHEDRFEAFLKSPDVGPAWAEYGGRETLRSYGVTPPTLATDTVGWVMASHELSAAVPVRHRSFLTSLMPSVSVGDYFFTHAGVRPGVPLSAQSPNDLMWIRRNFLEHTAAFDQTIVHGHTPTDGVHLDHRRIGIDTGAYASGVLTALRLQGDSKELIQTRFGPEGAGVERITL